MTAVRFADRPATAVAAMVHANSTGRYAAMPAASIPTTTFLGASARRQTLAAHAPPLDEFPTIPLRLYSAEYNIITTLLNYQ
jgi:hypothetical protein